ncbi:MAG: right-handed parallel beta-helix repeat-containing protein [Ignavibacteria bacterium]|nr:right-handed parallel beta-helix repeat-containing protein [Ignavibacteria bacterium]
MRTLKLVLLIALAMLLIFTKVQPEVSSYFVDNSNPNASDNNPGSENEPWVTVQKGIDVAQAGDTVFIKAGTYFISSSGLKMKRSGNTNNKIVFKNYGTDSVVINMRSAPSKGWNWTGTYYNNIVIDGLNFLHGEWPTVIQGDYNEIKNCYFGFSSGTTINVWGGSHNLISNNRIEASGWNGIGIESRPNDGNKGRADSNIVEFNHCFNSSDHMGINIFPNTGQSQDLMYYNIIRFNTLNGNHSSGIYLRRQVNCIIYDNLIYDNKEWGIFLHWKNSSDGAHISNLKIYNNTVVGNGYDGIDNHSHKDLIIKNNIFAYSGDYEIDMSSAVGTTGHNIDYNQYYTTNINETIITWGSGNLKYTLAEEQMNLGYDNHSIFGDPMFINMNQGNYSLLPSSSAINSGFNLGNPYNQAIDGTIRPQGNVYDIGAYEIISGLDVRKMIRQR